MAKKTKQPEQAPVPVDPNEPMTVIAWTKAPLGAIIRTSPTVPEDIAKLKAKSQLKQFLANESEGIKDENVVYEILKPGEDSHFDRNLPPRHISAIDFQGQIIELSPKKVYIVAMNANSVQPDQAFYLREQLSEAGVKAGVLLATPSDQPVLFIDEHPVELGDGDRQEQRMNARNQLVEAHNALQQAARALVSAEMEVLDQLGLAAPEEQAKKFSDLFVAIEQAYDAAEEPINADQMAQQLGAKQNEQS